MYIDNSQQSQMYASQMRMQKPSAEDMSSKIMQELDADGSGSINSDELSGLDDEMRSKIREADSNGDGTISEDELLSKIAEQIASKGPMGGGGPPPNMGAPNASDMVSMIMQNTDTDGDGEISTEELSAVDKNQQQKLAEADTDGDGIITKEELSSQITEDMGSRSQMSSSMTFDLSEMSLTNFKDMITTLFGEDESKDDAATQIQNNLSKLGVSSSDINELMNTLKSQRFDVSA